MRVFNFVKELFIVTKHEKIYTRSEQVKGHYSGENGLLLFSVPAFYSHGNKHMRSTLNYITSHSQQLPSTVGPTAAVLPGWWSKECGQSPKLGTSHPRESWDATLFKIYSTAATVICTAVPFNIWHDNSIRMYLLLLCIINKQILPQVTSMIKI